MRAGNDTHSTKFTNVIRSGVQISASFHFPFKLLPLTFDDVADDELTPAAGFDFAVDGNFAGLNEQFGLPAGGDHAGQLQKVIQADLWRFIRHVRILAAPVLMSSL